MEKNQVDENVCIVFDDGINLKTKKGRIVKIERNMLFFIENNGIYQGIPLYRIVRVIFNKPKYTIHPGGDTNSGGK